MVMDLLGPSLEDLFNKCNRRFSLKTGMYGRIYVYMRLCPPFHSPWCPSISCNSSADCRPDVGKSGHPTLKAFDPPRYQAGTTQVSMLSAVVMFEENIERRSSSSSIVIVVVVAMVRVG